LLKFFFPFNSVTFASIFYSSSPSRPVQPSLTIKHFF
jgi:hypothetical protein